VKLDRVSRRAHAGEFHDGRSREPKSHHEPARTGSAVLAGGEFMHHRYGRHIAPRQLRLVMQTRSRYRHQRGRFPSGEAKRETRISGAFGMMIVIRHALGTSFDAPRHA
jgi:hypothetical protein